MSLAKRKRLSELSRQQQRRLRDVSQRSRLGVESLEDRLLLSANDTLGGPGEHHTVFLRLAFGVERRALVDRRWSQWLDVEADTMASQEPGPRLFSWPSGR